MKAVKLIKRNSKRIGGLVGSAFIVWGLNKIFDANTSTVVDRAKILTQNVQNKLALRSVAPKSVEKDYGE